MIYIFSALYHEAEPLIREYGLKKKTDETCFPVFFDEEKQILLTVTGCGMNAAAAAVARICTKNTPQPEDFLVNIGTCAWVSAKNGSDETRKNILEKQTAGGICRNISEKETTGGICRNISEKETTGGICRNVSEKETADADGVHSSEKRKTVQEQSVRVREVYLCKKITEHVTGRTFYPDILYRHPFVEAEIVTGAMPYRTENKTELMKKNETAIKNNAAEGFLYDMEASSIYQAGAYFFNPHQMSFLKVVTDEGNVQDLSAEMLKQSIEGAVPEIRSYLDDLVKIDEIKKRQNRKELEEVLEFAQKLSADMHCSAVMRASVIQQLKYAVLAGIDYQGIIEEMYQAGELPCKDKREGKSCFEELGRKLL